MGSKEKTKDKANKIKFLDVFGFLTVKVWKICHHILIY